MYAIRPQGIDRDGKRQRRIDTSGQAEYDARKPVLLHVIAHTQHERVIDAGLARQQRLDVAATRYGLAIDQIDVDSGETLHEWSDALHDFAVRVHDERSAIEHELILSAEQIDVDHRQAAVFDAFAYDFFTAILIIERIRGAIDDSNELCTGSCSRFRRTRLPDVFADQKRGANPVQLDDACFVSSTEIALLVEDLVVGEFLLAIVGERRAIAKDRCCVEDRTFGVFRITHRDRNPAGFLADAA